MQPYFGRVFEKMRIVLKKKQYYAQILKIKCCNSLKFMYNDTCCGMIAVKREVAGSQKWQSGFPWSECQVRKLTTSHCTKEASLLCKGLCLQRVNASEKSALGRHDVM